jgi:S-adenosylmethionine decarboxylase
MRDFRINGKTLLLDLFKCDREKLQDVGLQHALLVELPERIGMHPITAPQIVRWDVPQCENKKWWGYSGTVLFAESHAYFHTWPEGGFVMVDLTSCKDFDEIVALEQVREVFGAEIVVPRVLSRGRWFYDTAATEATGGMAEPAQFVGTPGGIEVDVPRGPAIREMGLEALADGMGRKTGEERT